MEPPHQPDPDWISARDAADYVGTALDASNPAFAHARIIEWAASGLVRARCLRMVIRHHGVTLNDTDNCELTRPFWEGVRSRSRAGVWVTGEFTTFVTGRDSGTVNEVNVLGATFSLSDLRKAPGMPGAAIGTLHTAPPPPPVGAMPLTKRGRGGRRPNPFWEEAINAAWQALHGSTFKPAKQADLERWIADWLAEHDQDSNESQVRQRAKMIWDVWEP